MPPTSMNRPPACALCLLVLAVVAIPWMPTDDTPPGKMKELAPGAGATPDGSPRWRALLSEDQGEAPMARISSATNLTSAVVDLPGPRPGVAPPHPSRPHVIRTRRAWLGVSALPSKSTAPGTQDRLALFADHEFTVRWQTMADHGANNFAWYGRLLEDRLSAVTLTRVGDYAIIEVQSPRYGQYQVRARDGEPGEVMQFDAEALKGDGKCFVETAAFGDNGDPQAVPNEEPTPVPPVAEGPGVTGVTIDVLMVYTTKARDAAGGRAAMVAMAQSAVNGENSNFSRSDISHRMRLVQTREVSHTASGNLATELGWVAGNSTVASIRSEVGADIVAFLSDRDDTGTRGIAMQLGSTGGNSGAAFSANYYDTVSGVWPHEVGHNLGCQHNSAGVYSYSSGHYWPDDGGNGNTYGSLMSYIGIRVPYFSNPAVSHWSGATGSSSRDNARSIDNIGDNVSNYRAAKTLVEPSCVVTTSATKPLEGVDFNLSIRTTNGGPSTLTAGKIAVTLPTRLTLVSHNGGAAFNSTTKVWDVPDLADNASATLVLTVRANAGSAGFSLTPGATVSAVGSGVIDFDVYNNDGAVTIVPAAEPTPGLVLHYALDETSGKSAVDSATINGAQNAATTFAVPLWQPAGGVIGGALRLNPAAQADVAQAFIYDRTTPIIDDYPLTLALWARATPGTWYQVCAMLGDQTLGSSYFEIDFNTQRAQLIARNTAQVWATSPATLVVTDDAWHHLAAVYSSPSLRTLYVDGVAVATSTTNVPFVTNPTRFSIGALMRNAPTQSFPGYLDDIGLWNIALSPEHIALIHALGRHAHAALDDPAIATLLAVTAAQSGFARVGDLVWEPAAGLTGGIGTTGLRHGLPFVVLSSGGGGLIALTRPALSVDGPFHDGISLSWHSGFPDWLLQESSDLSPGGWSSTTQSAADNGLMRTIHVPITDADPHFFRLSRP